MPRAFNWRSLKIIINVQLQEGKKKLSCDDLKSEADVDVDDLHWTVQVCV